MTKFPKWYIKKNALPHTALLKKLTLTEIDPEFGGVEESYTDYSVRCHIQPVKEEYPLLTPGKYKTGDMKGWFLDVYNYSKCLRGFDVSTDYTYDITKIEIVNGIASLVLSGAGASPTYPADNPTIEPKDACFSNYSLVGFSAVESKPTGTDIKYIIYAGTKWYYWTGTAWAESNESYAQSSTAWDINENLDTFPVKNGPYYIWRAFLHSEGLPTQDPELDVVKMELGLEIEVDDEIEFNQKRYKIIKIEDWSKDKTTPHKEGLLRIITGRT